MDIVLIGEPNTGKTSLFNRLTGSQQFVGNWPGVTVEHKTGHYLKNKNISITDLPGIYSLSPYSPEEKVSRDYLLHQQPAALLDIIDGTNLERNLYLSLQLLDMDLPLVLALNMVEDMKKVGIHLDVRQLSQLLGVPIIEINAMTGAGTAMLMTCVQAEIQSGRTSYVEYDPKLEAAIHEVEMLLQKEGVLTNNKRWYALKLLERDPLIEAELHLSASTQKEIDETIAILERIFGEDSVSLIINERYKWIEAALQRCCTTTDHPLTLTEKIDRLVTNRFLALPIFAFIIWLVYFLSIQTIGTLGSDWLNDTLFGQWIPNYLSDLFQKLDVYPWLQSLVIDGIVAGVGSVLGFLPQIMMLFLCLAFLEDCGYMSRIAYILDCFFRRLGLSGKSFIPMLISTGCGVPGIMTCRTIEDEKERQMSIMLTTFMPCSAKLAIIGLIAGAFFPNKSWVAPLTYFICFAVIILSGLMLKKTKYFTHERGVFLMELPNYHWPRWTNLWRQTWNNSFAFVKKAGTIIFLFSILLWFASHFNFHGQMVDEEASILASVGKQIAFIFAPLGFGDWRATVAVFTGLSAKENVVNTLGVLYHQQVTSDNGQELWSVLRQMYTPLAGFSFLLFNLICAPCIAAIGAMKRELGTVKLALKATAFQCGLAYILSFIIYQLGSLLLYQRFTLGTLLAFASTLALLYFVLRKEKTQWETSL